jgi:pyroglutamyl-peptidase
MPLTVLLTGFGPFPGAPTNPSAMLPARLAERRRPALADVRRVAHVFRTSYAAVDRDMLALLAHVRPDVVLLFGVATRTNHLRIETRARNGRSVLFADVDGHRPEQSAIATGAPATLAGYAPHAMLRAAVRARRLPAQLSHNAGRYLCNFAYWRALAAAHGRRAPLVQFVHVPMVRGAPTRKAPGRRRLTVADLDRAGEAILMALVAAARVRQREGRAAIAAAKPAPLAVPIPLQPNRKRESPQAVAARGGQPMAARSGRA